jgi:cysteine synthase A
MTNIEENIRNDKVLETTSPLNQAAGLWVGISSGTSVSGALELARRFENKGKKIIVILSDTCEPYLSTGIHPFEEVKSKKPDLFWSF